MSRHRFRSQPTLQRSGGRTPAAIIGLALLAAVAVGVGALVTNLIRTPAPPAEAIPPLAIQATPTDEPPPRPAIEPPPLATPTPAPPQVAAVQANLRAAMPERVKPKTRTPAGTGRPARPPTYEAAKSETQQATWEQQQRDYETARAAYESRERSEGFRWAQQNRIKVQRYCRAARQRTPAFMEGCMSYLGRQ